jgi:uncharacterized protein (UPF0261 family)
VISSPGGPFYDPDADHSLFTAIEENLRDDIEMIEIDCPINDAHFAQACVKALLKNIAKTKPAA